MNTCPMCNKDINHLDYCHAKYENGTYNGTLMSDDPTAYKNNSIEFRCPECNELLYIHEDEACDFLNTY